MNFLDEQENAMKGQNKYFLIGLIILMVGSLMIVSCSEKKPRKGSMAADTSVSDQAAADAAAKAQAITEEEIAEQQRISEEEEAIRVKEVAQKKFVNTDVYFNFDDATLTSTARGVLKQKVAFLRNNSGVTVVIEGHCDERGTGEYNIALGQSRSSSIKSFLINAGVGSSRLDTVSYGEERPVDCESNETAWARNRRGHFSIQ
jgi:peptidoglycan-associated lipoprotein